MGIKGKARFFLVLFCILSQWEYSEFGFLRQTISPKAWWTSVAALAKSSRQTTLLTRDVWEMPTYQVDLAPSENSVQESEFSATEKNIVFWGFNIYRHSVHLFLIYDGVKDMKFAANWIDSQFYWHFFIVIKAPGLSLFLFPPIFYAYKWYARSVLEKLSKWWALDNNCSLHKPKWSLFSSFSFKSNDDLPPEIGCGIPVVLQVEDMCLFLPLSK